MCSYICLILITLLPRRQPEISNNIDKFGFMMADSTSNEIITEQKGIFRTNCLDWFDHLSRPWAISLTLERQFGSHEFCSRYFITDCTGAIFATYTPRMDSFRKLLDFSSRNVGREWRCTVSHLCRHWSTKYKHYSERETDIGRLVLFLLIRCVWQYIANLSHRCSFRRHEERITRIYQ